MVPTHTRRPIRIQCCIDAPEYASGPMPTLEVSEVPTPVLQNLEAWIKAELADRKRITMLVSEYLKRKE